MKKLIYFAMILAMVFVSCKKEDKPITVPESWETGLGLASFATDSIWTITNDTITQVWSDAVHTSSCSSKDYYSGGDYMTSSYNINCRSNPGQKGDLFSWRAVTEVQNLCPEGWRVPDSADFRNLDIALGFNGENREPTEVNGHSWQDQLDAYLTTWGGAYGGVCVPIPLVGLLDVQGILGAYWSQSDTSVDLGLYMYFATDGTIGPQSGEYKSLGFTLRCIRE